MQTTINYNDDYSHSYREQFFNAVQDSKHLGFTRVPFISEQTPIPDSTLLATRNLINQFSLFLESILYGYWGNSCQTLATNIFAYLNNQGIAADIVLGNVIINGTDEFETTLASLQTEMQATEPLTGAQAVHAWVSLGDDTIIDAALPPRLVKHYGLPPRFNDMIFIGRATEMSSKYRVRYQPILVGSDFFAKTNPPDPMSLLDELNLKSLLQKI